MAQADSQLLTQSSDGAQPRLDILHKSDYASERERIPRWTPGSCKWILQQEQYRSWIQDKKSSFLWLSGGRGCGKTVLASFLVEELKSQNSQSSLPGTVCCLFFNANNKDYKNPSTALCTLLHQLLNHKDQAIRESLWNKYIAPEFREQDQAFTTQLAVLWRILALVLSDPDCGNVMCVVDGLSDCGEDRIPFINSIARLFEEHDPNGEKHGKNHGFLKIIAMTQFPINSSSSHRRLETADMRWLQLPPTDDVSLFIDARTKDMRSFSRIPKEKRTKFAHDLLEVAKNTFLLAALILDWLEDVEEYDRVFERLEDLKSCDQDKHQSDVDNTISSIYEMSLKDCPDNHMTRKLFRLTVGAFEPLTLEEINVAMAVPCGTDIGGNELEQISEPVIKKSCGILLRVVYNRVIFRHRTAREFLTNQVQSKMDESNTWKHQLNPTESNSLLAEICVTYLLNPNVSKSNREAATSNVEAGVQDYPSNNRFLDYASKNWAEHFTVAKEPEQLVKNVVSLCDPVSEHFNTWFYNYWKSLHHSNSRLKGINNLMVASHLGHLSVIRWLKTQKDKINIAATDKNGWTALHWASQWENLEIAEELLDLGADIDAESEKKRTPLDFAAAKGYETLVQLFLSHKSAKPTSVVDKNSNVLVSAPPLSTSQERKIARSSAYIGKDGVRSLMLFEATQEGNEALVKTLLERGTRTNQLHSNGLTALHVAASQNYPSIVLLLLEKGRADFDKMTHDGKTALVLASEKGHENIVEILLKFGANTDIGGYTPYSSANENIKSLLGRRRIVEGPSLTPRSPSPPPLLLQRKDKSHSSHDFHATLLDLWADGTPLHEARSPFVHPTVHDVLYGDGPNNIMAQDGEDLRNKRTFRWIHLPANNVGIKTCCLIKGTLIYIDGLG